MAGAGPNGHGPAAVPWDEAREVVTLILTLCAALMVVSPILYRLIDGQLDRNGLRSALTGAQPSTGIVVLGAAVLVATTPVADVTPRLRTLVVQVAGVVLAVSLVAVFDTLFSESSGGLRPFSTRFPTLLRFAGPTALLSGTALWLARRVVPLPDR